MHSPSWWCSNRSAQPWKIMFRVVWDVASGPGPQLPTLQISLQSHVTQIFSLWFTHALNCLPSTTAWIVSSRALAL